MYKYRNPNFLSILLLVFSLINSVSPRFLPLHIEGKYLVDSEGNRHIIHGFAQTYSPWFNERGSKWDNYNVEGCLQYNQGLIDDILNVGWKMKYIRIHMDPYWSNSPDVYMTDESNITAFVFERFEKYLDEVFVPMAEYAISKEIYVIMRPPGVCPKNITIGDDYQKYLLKVWEHVAQHSKLKNNGYVMYELANEPVDINHIDGENAFKALRDYFQPIVNIIRQHTNSIVLIPGLGYESLFSGFTEYTFEGTNIGFAAHLYPGWFNSATENDESKGYEEFKESFDKEIGLIAKTHPVIITEMDWAPEKYDSSWGKGVTGVAGGKGFGANFMRIAEESEVSWLLFTGADLLAKYDDSLPDGDTFLTDPEACPRPIYRKYLEYVKDESESGDKYYYLKTFNLIILLLLLF